MYKSVNVYIDSNIYIYMSVCKTLCEYSDSRRKFRSQTSDNLDR